MIENEFVIINKDDYINQFTPSDSEITNYYNNNTSLFLESEKRDFVQFNFKEKNDAEKFKKNIASLSKEEIINYAKDNEIFFNEFKKVSKDEVLEELSKKIFSLQINEISSVIETALAKHIVIVNNVYPQTQNSLEKSKTRKQKHVNTYKHIKNTFFKLLLCFCVCVCVFSPFFLLFFLKNHLTSR